MATVLVVSFVAVAVLYGVALYGLFVGLAPVADAVPASPTGELAPYVGTAEELEDALRRAYIARHGTLLDMRTVDGRTVRDAAANIGRGTFQTERV